MADQTTRECVLITGANGFIGARICRTFLDQGYDVIAGVRRTADLSLLSGLPVNLRYGDITKPETLPEMVRGVDRIIHNAGLVKATRPEQFFAVNEQGTRNLLEAVAAHNAGVKRIVYVSSLAVAGPSAPGRPVKETDPAKPITTYGRSKLAGELVALSFAGRLPVVSVRPPGVYGPGDKELFAVFQTLRYHLKPLIGDLDRRIQLVHVDDLCRGLFGAATAKVDCGNIFFLAEQRSYTMREFIELARSAVDSWSLPLRIPSPLFRMIAAVSEAVLITVGAAPMLTREKAGELLASWEIDATKAEREFGFVSQISLAEGLRDTMTWYRQKGWL